MRFILNFFFFGLLFYLIWMFFPDAFLTLVSWANHVVAFFRDLFMGLSDKIQNQTPPPAPVTPSAWLTLPFFIRLGR